MTTDKLPDLVWEGVPYVRKSTLDAMTAERDELRERVKTWQWEAGILRNERDSAREALAKATEDAAYCKYRLLTIIPLFEEARDALPAISLASAKLRGLDLSLGDRMDDAGTYTRADWDAAQPETKP